LEFWNFPVLEFSRVRKVGNQTKGKCTEMATMAKLDGQTPRWITTAPDISTTGSNTIAPFEASPEMSDT